MYLFSYGSNHPAQLKERLEHPVLTFSAVLRGWERVFRGHSRTWSGAGIASIERHAGMAVYGLACLVTPRDLERMDIFEGVPAAYRRLSVHIQVGIGKEPHLAAVYVATSTVFNPPSKTYLKEVARLIGTHWQGPHGKVRPEDIPIH